MPGVLLIWIMVGQVSAALQVGAGGGSLDIFVSSIIFLLFLPLSLGDGQTQTEILSERGFKPKTNHQTMALILVYKTLGTCTQELDILVGL